MHKIEIYPDSAIKANMSKLDLVNNGVVTNIPALFFGRVAQTPDKEAYRQYDPVSDRWNSYSWQEMNARIDRWRKAIKQDGFKPDERAAIRMHNGVDWVCFDISVLASKMVVVPLYAEDRADSIHYILEHTESRLLVVENIAQWQEMKAELAALDSLKRVVVVNCSEAEVEACRDERVRSLETWLDAGQDSVYEPYEISATALASIVYTSGTTGKPKGVMLSHQNILENAFAGLKSVAVFPDDLFLSFLPLSHMFERTVGYYLTMMAGATVAYNRSIPELLEDLSIVKPTAMIAVPRIFEKAHTSIFAKLEEESTVKQALFKKAVAVGWHKFLYEQGRATWQPSQLLYPLLDKLVGSKVRQRFGGNLRLVVVGGAPLSSSVAEVFIGLGLNILQGYGLTESSPVLSVNTFSKNKPDSIGLPLRGIELRLGEFDELLTRSDCVMMSYWRDEDATRECIDEAGWLHTGDIASVDDEGFVRITGRIKEIIVLSNGEKVPPVDMELAVCELPLFEHIMIVGEKRAYLTAVVVLNPEVWPKTAQRNNLEGDIETALKQQETKDFVLKRISGQLSTFPGYAFIKDVVLTTKPWTVESGYLTPTLKLKRPKIQADFVEAIDAMYGD